MIRIFVYLSINLVIHLFVDLFIYLSLHMSSRQNPLHVTSCYCYTYRFWGCLSLSRVLWISAYSRSNMKPKANPKQARKCIEELFCWYQVLRQQFMFLSFCVRLHACSSMFLSFTCIFLSFCINFPSLSFHSPFMFLSFVLISFIFLSYIPFVFIPMCIRVLPSSFLLLFNLHACSFNLHSYPLISFLKLGKWL